MNKIDMLDNFLNEYSINENIVVHRMINFNPFQFTNSFIERGYMSTSLVNGAINYIHNHEFRLKILLPKGTKGYYVDFISNREGEYEYLLPRNSELKFIRRIIADDYKYEIHCRLKR